MYLSNAAFRAIEGATPGPYTFILPATSEVPRRLMHPKKRTVGVRIPDHRWSRPCSGSRRADPVEACCYRARSTDDRRWQIKERLDHLVGRGDRLRRVRVGPTTVVDFSDGSPVVERVGAGDSRGSSGPCVSEARGGSLRDVCRIAGPASVSR